MPGREKRERFQITTRTAFVTCCRCVRGSFQALGLVKNIFCSVLDVLGCFLPKPVLNPLMKPGRACITSNSLGGKMALSVFLE